MFLQTSPHFCTDMKTPCLNAEIQVIPGDMSSLVFTVQCSHYMKLCRAGSSLLKNKLPTVWSVGCFKREVEVVSRHLFSLPIVHLASPPRTTKDRLKASLLQMTSCPALLGGSWLLQAMYLPAYTKISLGFSETQNDLRNQRGKEPIFSITFPFHAMKTRRRY